MTKPFAVAFVLFASSFVQANEVPVLRRRVTDLAGMLSPAAASRIEASLEEFEKRTGGQVAVLTVPSLNGQPVESFTMAVVEQWKLGRKGHDDGVLVFAAKEDRKTCIEVGYGFEGKLTDVQASRILREQMAPAFRRGDFDAGFTLSVTHVLLALDGTTAPVAAAETSSAESIVASLQSGQWCRPMAPLGFRLMFGLIALPIIGLFWLLGIFGGPMGWGLYLFLIPFCTAFPGVALGACGGLGALAAHLILFPLLKLTLGRSKRVPSFLKNFAASNGVVAGGRGTRSTSRSSWTLSSSRSSSSSFRGGGGSFGGGGASGSW